ncbi:MAG: hypothetical protein U5R06_20230 [candidate division KSB1 bacterium]|nr:hypothetical protein [candidate division KSB1 bacterium]
MLTFENCIIKKFWPKDEKGDEDEIIRQLHLQAEVILDNSVQVGELFNNMVRGLVRITFLDTLSGEEYILPAATIKPFNVKQKKVKVGKGDDADVVKTEYAALTIVTKIDNEKGGALLADIYQFFNIEIQINIEQLQPFEQVPGPTPEQSGSETDDDTDSSVF